MENYPSESERYLVSDFRTVMRMRGRIFMTLDLSHAKVHERLNVLATTTSDAGEKIEHNTYEKIDVTKGPLGGWAKIVTDKEGNEEAYPVNLGLHTPNKNGNSTRLDSIVLRENLILTEQNVEPEGPQLHGEKPLRPLITRVGELALIEAPLLAQKLAQKHEKALAELEEQEKQRQERMNALYSISENAVVVPLKVVNNVHSLAASNGLSDVDSLQKVG